MRGIVIALLGRDDVGRELGKLGSSTDITYYNSKKGDVVHTILYPSRYPQSVQPLGNVLGISQEVIFDIQEVNAQLGEQIVASSNAGHKRAWLLLGENVGEDDVAPIFKDAGIAATLVEDARELRQKMEDIVPSAGVGEPVVVVDQCFSVKGVGTVALGFLVSGELKKHDELVVSPGGARATIRSIQVQDEDQNAVQPFTRVGLALRGVEPDVVGKGSIMSPAEQASISDAKAVVDVSRYWRGKIATGTVLHLSSMFQFSPARVLEAEGNTLSLTLERPFITTGGNIIAFHLDSPKQRVVGSVRFC